MPRDPAMFGRLCAVVGMMLTVKACEAEHADLLSDVLPGSWGAESLQFGFQFSTHQQNPVSHRLNIILPVQGNSRKSIHFCKNQPFFGTYVH